MVALSRFQGELLLHMADEEESAQPALWAALDDASPSWAHVHGAMVASIPPPEKAQALAWMLPAMNAPDRAALLRNPLRASAPAAAFEPDPRSWRCGCSRPTTGSAWSVGARPGKRRQSGRP